MAFWNWPGSACVCHRSGEREEDQAHVIAEGTAKHLGDREQQFIQLDRLHILRTPPREGEELAGELRPQLGGVLCLLDQYSKVLPLELILHQLQVTGNDGKQVIEVMRDAARQLADRFHLLRLRKPTLTLP